MKILMVTNYFGSHKGGIEIVAEELFRQFAARGQEVIWAAGNATAPPEAMGLSRTLSLPITNFVEKAIGLPFPIPGFKALRQLSVAVKNADIVVLHDCLYLSNIAAFLLAHRSGIPTLVVQHTVPNEKRLANLVMKIATTLVTRPMLQNASQVFYISETVEKFYGSLRFKAPPRVVFNGVDCSMMRPLRRGETRADLRRRFGLPLDQTVVLFVGRFVEKKGLPVLQRMVGLRNHHTWAFAGWGPMDPRSWQAENVKVYSDLRGPSLAELYRASDVLVLPSAKEGFPLVMQEALATGLPVVCGLETATSDSSMASLVKGVPIYQNDESRTAKEFVAAIDATVASVEIAHEGVQLRRAFAMNRYSWSKAADKYLEIAQRLCRPDTSPSLAVNAEARKLHP